jgi:hypothetical protein
MINDPAEGSEVDASDSLAFNSISALRLHVTAGACKPGYSVRFPRWCLTAKQTIVAERRAVRNATRLQDMATHDAKDEAAYGL